MKNPNSRTLRASLLSIAITLALPLSVSAQDAGDDADDKQLEEVVVVGSRARGHTATETLAPVDLISREELESTGALEVGKILQSLEPSFNFSTTYISDGTDIIRPATLRALGPDQVLVLVNGKRRHQQALVNVQQTIGRGSAGTDINAIPLSAIARIEVLRDGAAAQYGSDAIAGVINIILKDNTDDSQATMQVGQTYEGDGDNYHGGLNTGWAFGDGGFFNLTAEYRDRRETNRAGPDSLRVDPPAVTQRIGDPDAKDKYLWFNSGMDIGENAEFYAFGGWSEREGDSSGFFRTAGDGRTVPEYYPNGFLPNIITTVTDGSFAAGFRGAVNDTWNFDASASWGRDRFDFHERGSVNVSWYYEPAPGGGIYGESPTEADTGSLIQDQTTLNLDFTGSFSGIGDNPMFLATGLEYRRENYEVVAGDPVSWSYGRTNNPAIVILNQNGGTAAAGIQGFPGFQPSTEVDDGRHSWAIYGDLEAPVNDQFTLGAALRFEDFSDFGNTAIGKLSARYEASDTFALRGTVSTGFRAPGIQQALFSQVSTNLNSAGVLTETLTARADSPVTRALGLSPLKEEESLSASLGFTAQLSDELSLTMDVFRIDIDDRIIFSGNIAPESPAGGCGTNNANCPIRAILDPFRVGQAQFFTNAIDTETQGIDIVADYTTELGNGDDLTLTALFHFNDTEVTAIRSSSSLLSASQLFPPEQVTLVEEGQPGAHHVLGMNWDHDAWNFDVRASYYGSVAGEGFTPGIKQKWDGEWLADLTVGYRFSDSFKLSVGATNLFDSYPDKWDEVGGFPFPQLGFVYGWETVPFGINGGYYFVRADVGF
jgi:iron complex outermembrane receptor protein